MNPSHRDGWGPSGQPPLSGQANSEQARSQGPNASSSFGPAHGARQQPPSGSSVLPPPAPLYPAAAGPSGPALPSLASLSQQSPHRPSHSSHEQTYPPHPPASSYAPTGIGHSAPQALLTGQQGYDRDRDLHDVREREARDRAAREREFDQQIRREREIRDREIRERQQREQIPAQQSHAEPIQLHQPAPVGPQMRSAIHGPNGLLANAGPSSGPQTTLSGPNNPNGQSPLFGGASQHEPNSRGILQQGNQVLLSSIIPFPGGQGQQQLPTPGLAQGQQPILNDALSYLDQVKVQFVSEPNVYNQFLDIMKDFKSQSIDTPGVIRRVSSLFAGNPNLIQGFNTFLPPGYRIECGTADDPNAIRVTTPMGTTVSPMGSALRPPSRAGGSNGLGSTQSTSLDPMMNRGQDSSWQQPGQGESNDGLLSPRNYRAGPPGYASQPNQPNLHNAHDSSIQRDQSAFIHGPGIHQQEQRGVSQLQNAVSAASADGTQRPGGPGAMNAPLSNDMINVGGPTAHQGGPPSMEKRGPVEFNHAISYVNKIKNRFSQQPEIYKQFLEILQTYQRESKPIQDVYAQVTHLFNGAPDLLEDFKQFLPESAAQAKAAAARQAAEDATMVSSVRNEPGYANSTSQLQHTPRPEQHRLPPLGNFAPTPSASRDSKRKRADRQGQTIGPSAFVGQEIAGGARGNLAAGGKRMKQIQQQQPPIHQHQQNLSQIVPGRTEPQIDIPAIAPSLVPALPQPMPPATSTAATTDELAAFDRAKKFIGNKNTMNEFLKLCNLFSQDLIDKNVLVHRMQNFIGGNAELFQWFKDFLNYDGKDELLENRAKAVNGRVALSNCRGLGPSYRLLPKKERNKKCSGRDEVCNAVLNDEWATHPTWASEESGFAAHRKNIHEDGLHRIEEERHDYDLNIGVCERTIQLLEPIAQHIRLLPDEEKSRYKLQPHLGGPSETIYKRMIMKIYGRDHGRVVIENMFAQPSGVVPIVLMRCKQKFEEWKASQREWEKVWREQTQKMFWRSLDHQGINVKMLDKRQFQPKTLQNEIHVKYEEEKRQRQIQPGLVAKDQAVHTFEDPEVLVDVTRLMLIHAEHSHPSEFSRISSLLRDFVPLFFSLSTEAFEERILDILEPPPEEDDFDEDGNAVESGGNQSSRRSRRFDLLRDVLDRNKLDQTDADPTPNSNISNTRLPPEHASEGADGPVETQELNVEEAATETAAAKKWLDHPTEGNLRKKAFNVKPNEPFYRHSYNLYANLDIFCFFRVFVVLYERLQRIKAHEFEVHEAVRRGKVSKAAIDLHMIDKQPSNFFDDTSSSANYYEQILRMLEDNAKGELELNLIEEVLRRYYLASGWQLYSFDRLLGSLVRFAIALLNNDGRSKTSDIIQLWMKDRRKDLTTHDEELAFRRAAEKHIKDGDVYRIAFDESTRTARIRVLAQNDATFSPNQIDPDQGFLTYEQRWQYYVSSYSSLAPTEGVVTDAIRVPFLKRIWRASKASTIQKSLDGEVEVDPAAALDAEGRLNHIRSKEELMLRIGVDDYKIWYSEIGSEEWWLLEKANASMDDNKDASDLSSIPAEGTNGKHKSDRRDGSQKSSLRVRDNEFEEEFILNNAWMRSLTSDKVEQALKQYQDWKSDEVKESNGTAGEDTEMID